jgi:hypothetical protein
VRYFESLPGNPRSDLETLMLVHGFRDSAEPDQVFGLLDQTDGHKQGCRSLVPTAVCSKIDPTTVLPARLLHKYLRSFPR